MIQGKLKIEVKMLTVAFICKDKNAAKTSVAVRMHPKERKCSKFLKKNHLWCLTL